MTKKQQSSAYSDEFRETAIQLALSSGKSITAVAGELGVSASQLCRWVKMWKKQNGGAEHLQSKPTDERVKELEKRNRELQQEVEILKKAAAYFAKTLL
jgi:transposase